MLNTLDAITRSIQCGEVLVHRNSNAVDYIVASLFGGYVRVMFHNGSAYTFKARKRDILKLMANENISLGFWVNNCLNLDAPVNQYMYKFASAPIYA